MTVNGIDVASYQNTTYTTTGSGFVIVKATEGTGYLNPRHAGQIATGRARGLTVGHYHFARPGSMSAQLAYFLDHAAAKTGDLLALDWEDQDVPYTDKDAWIKAAQKAMPHNRVLLYCNRDFWLNRDHTGFAGDGLWIADPEADPGHPRVKQPWVIHQYGETGGTDLNVANFTDRAALDAWAGKPVPPAHQYEPFPGAAWFAIGRRSPVVTAMHERLTAAGCSRYRSNTNKNTIGSGDIASYEAWQRKYNTTHHKGWTGAALKWPPGKETWDALQVPNV